MPLENKKHEQFCWEYIACGYKAIPAYEKIYTNATPQTVRTNCYRLLAREDIKKRLTEIQNEIFQSLFITAERVLIKLGEVAFAEKDDEVYNVSYQLRALELIQKQMGLQSSNANINATVEAVIFEGEDELED